MPNKVSGKAQEPMSSYLYGTFKHVHTHIHTHEDWGGQTNKQTEDSRDVGAEPHSRMCDTLE